MAVTQYPFTGDGNIRVFPIAVKIISEDYVKIEIDTVPFLATTDFDIINNSIVFRTAPANLSSIIVWVADSIESIADLGTTTNVDLVGINMADINIIADNIEDIKTASSDLVKWTEPFIATAGQTAFISTHVVDKVSVYLNGSRLTYPTDYTTLEKTVTLTTPAEGGDEVMLEGGQATSALPNYVAVTLNTIAEMLAYDPTVANTVIVKDENQGGTFVYDATLIATNNGGTIFNGWVRQYSGAVNVKWFGATGDGTTDDTISIQNAVGLYKDTFIPEGIYIVSDTILLSDPSDATAIRPHANIRGEGSNKSIFAPRGMDAVVIETGHTITTSTNASRLEGLVLEDFGIIGDGSNTTNNHGILPRGVYRSTFKNLVIRSVGGNGIYSPRDVALEVVSGYTGGSDIYGVILELDNVFIHTCGASGIYSDIFSFSVRMYMCAIQDNARWGAVLSGANLVIKGGTFGYNGRLAGLVYGEGGGLWIGDGVETTPMSIDISNTEFDRNEFNNLRITRGLNITVANNRFLDSDDNSGAFWCTEHIYMNGSYCAFDNNYFRAPSATNQPGVLFKFDTSSAVNKVNIYYPAPGISTGIVEVTDVSVNTPGNMVKKVSNNIVSLNRAYTEKPIANGVFTAQAISGTAVDLIITNNAQAYFSEDFVSNIFTAPVAGIYEIVGYFTLSGWDTIGTTQLGTLLRVDRGSGYTTEFRDIDEHTVVATTNNKRVAVKYTVELKAGNTIKLQGFSSPRSATILATAGYGQITCRMI